MKLLTISDLQVTVGQRQILPAISLSVKAGEFIGLIGANGAGKSTLLRAMLGLVPARGAVTLDGRDLLHMAAGERAKHIGFLPQEREVAWPISVSELVALGRRAVKSGFVGLSQADEAAIAAAMTMMNITALQDRPVTELSGGERARVLIARVLAQQTNLIFADEPVAGLDPAHQLDLMQGLGQLAQQGRSVIASFHELGLAASFCTRLILLKQGRIIADGRPEQVATAELLQQAYGISAHIMQIDGQLIVQPKSRL